MRYVIVAVCTTVGLLFIAEHVLTALVGGPAGAYGLYLADKIIARRQNNAQGS